MDGWILRVTLLFFHFLLSASSWLLQQLVVLSSQHIDTSLAPRLNDPLLSTQPAHPTTAFLLGCLPACLLLSPLPLLGLGANKRHFSWQFCQDSHKNRTRCGVVAKSANPSAICNKSTRKLPQRHGHSSSSTILPGACHKCLSFAGR